MKTYLHIGLARSDGQPDNSALAVAVELNRHGFVLEDAYIQGHFPVAGNRPVPVLLARVDPPADFKRQVSRLVAKLACGHAVMQRVPEPAPLERRWLVTPAGVSRIEHND